MKTHVGNIFCFFKKQRNKILNLNKNRSYIIKKKTKKSSFCISFSFKIIINVLSFICRFKKKYNVRSLPIRKDDEVVIVRGKFKGNKGKVTQVYRKKWAVHVEKISKNKLNGAPYQIPLSASQLVITKIKLDKCREDLLKRKAAGIAKQKGQKYTVA
ncbi:hypothetical protein IMG5_113160 [Ichthyophthirius multifiliis]|uniref:KOW domain-containing protein n=1 Tax=Ichthyophthirius multifiliis TaxID=5932 RepID=G0QTY8_ICHMU|nr:hypothetical protein IMG5_113160 [Ichthyophthirius multifiliis]EGR31317.1 hypothetical protein IMG5_113160 [Ichthyophthirius multifiliis]|eukprot:XP_004034803.1 hypothetical protein IMG5_113160 [Ichthyophthirius multifiliis]